MIYEGNKARKIYIYINNYISTNQTDIESLIKKILKLLNELSSCIVIYIVIFTQ